MRSSHVYIYPYFEPLDWSWRHTLQQIVNIREVIRLVLSSVKFRLERVDRLFSEDSWLFATRCSWYRLCKLCINKCYWKTDVICTFVLRIVIIVLRPWHWASEVLCHSRTELHFKKKKKLHFITGNRVHLRDASLMQCCHTQLII